MTLEFELSISAAEASPGGGNVTVRYPKGMRMGAFSLTQISQIVAEMAEELRARQPRREWMEQAGGALFDSLFDRQVLAAYRECRTLAESQHTGVRLRLFTDQPAVMAVPWEYLYDSQNSGWLALDPKLSLVRGLPLGGRDPLPVDDNLRVLVMIADPTDLDPLDSGREWANLAAATGVAAVELIRIEPTLVALQDALRQRQPHIFHFVGHGSADGEAVLFLRDADGLADAIAGDRLSPLLAGCPSLRLVFLNACEGSAPGTTSAFAGLAQQLIQQQIPAVLAMQAPIYDTHALGFSLEFYTALADGVAVERAVQEGRKRIHQTAYSWGIPTFYFQSGEPFAVPPLSAQKKAERLWGKVQAISDIAGRRLLLQRIVEQVPDHPGAASALAQLAREAEADPLYAAAEAYVGNEKWREAHRVLEQIERLAPNFRRTRSLLAQVLGRLGGAPPPPAGYATQHEEYRPILSALQSGRLLPFLGWDAGQVGRPLGDGWVQGLYPPDPGEMAQELTRLLAGAVEGVFSLPQVSQYTHLLEGESALYDRLTELYSGGYPPTMLHRLLAELPGRLGRKGWPADSSRRMIIFTVAFDDLLERAFADVGQPYHLFAYRHHFEDGAGVGQPGRFAHTPPDGDPVEVFAPNEYDAHNRDRYPVIVKLSGQGVSPQPGSVMVTEDQYLAHLPVQEFGALLPATLLSEIKRRSFLFFGYSLQPWHLRLLWQRMRYQGRRLHDRSWAIVSQESALEREFWRREEIVPIVTAPEGVLTYVNDWLEDLEARQ